MVRLPQEQRNTCSFLVIDTQFYSIILAVYRSALDELPIVLEGDEEAMEEVPPSTSTDEPLYLHTPAELIKLFKTMGHVSEDTIQRPLVVGMVGYPNVGKSSTINKLVGSKKVSVSSTPGKTRHFQTIHIDKQVLNFIFVYLTVVFSSSAYATVLDW